MSKDKYKKYLGMLPLSLEDAEKFDLDESEENFEKIKVGDFSLRKISNKKKIKPRQNNKKKKYE